MSAAVAAPRLDGTDTSAGASSQGQRVAPPRWEGADTSVGAESSQGSQQQFTHIIWGEVPHHQHDTSSSTDMSQNPASHVMFRSQSGSESGSGLSANGMVSSHQVVVPAATSSGSPRSPGETRGAASGKKLLERFERKMTSESAASSNLMLATFERPPYPAGTAAPRPFEQVLDAHGLWSEGSNLHASGKCKLCHYFRSMAQCDSGSSCKHCHIPHTDAAGGGSKKLGLRQRLHAKHLAQTILTGLASDPEEMQRAIDVTTSKSRYLRTEIERADALLEQGQPLPFGERLPKILSL